MLKRVGILVLVITQLGVAADKTLLQNPQRGRGIAEVEGIVESVDTVNPALALKDDQGHRWKIATARDTAITNTDNAHLSLTDLKQDDRVRVYYTTFNMTARQIDRVTAPILPTGNKP